MTIIEVFIESYCAACVTVVRVLKKLVTNPAFELRIYHRHDDPSEFKARQVTIIPATFINNRLVFYGEFTETELKRQLESTFTN